MNFVFEGFSATYNVIFLVALFVFTIGVAVWTYKGVGGLSPAIRGVLITLRASVFMVLVLLLLNPAFTIQRENLLKPEIAVLLDNSQSSVIEKGEYPGESAYRQVIDDLGLADTSTIQFSTWAFDGQASELPLDSLSFDGTETDINRALTTFREQITREQAVILISDGIYNKGRDPSYIASQYPVPIFTVAVGDTSRLDDIVVQSVTSNNTAYKNAVTPVAATIRNDGFPNTDITVQLRREGRVIDEQTFRSDQTRSVHEARFELELDEAGLQQYEIFVPEVEGEWSTANNQEVFNIEVLDDKIRIMQLAFDIHPDVKSLRSILREDESIELDYRTWVSGERFVEGSFPLSPDTLDLVILQGFPTADMPRALIDQVREYTQGLPVVFLSSPAMDYDLLSTLYGDLSPGRATSSGEKRDIRPVINAEYEDHPLLELPAANLDRAPPLYGPVQDFSAISGSNVLLKTNFRGSELDVPLLATRTIGNIRTALLSAHGYYRWSLSPDEQVRDYTVELINNLIKWTASSPDSQLLEIQPARNMFEETENVVLNAFLRNEAGQEEDDAVIEIELIGEGFEDRLYTMNSQGLGQYRLRVGNLPEGMYRFNASARKGSHTIEERTGEFSVGSTNLEYVNTVRNDALLAYLAEQSGGVFFSYQQAGDLIDHLRQQGSLESQVQVTSREVLAYQNPIWFILVILLLTAEWVIRKVVSLP